ncbi:hypothetical protein [Paenibacillus ihuae]|uniref:hypothetical protein n=1 Tax=Paenibacillus ihuae TaxID=1232431 RepID=UPI0006D57460|nr:hypothetical protein [Paenibacillus ihuae]
MEIQLTKVEVTILIEGNQGDRNFSAYIPELRLGAMGHTKEEARENVIDLAMVEKHRLLKTTKENAPVIEKLELLI